MASSGELNEEQVKKYISSILSSSALVSTIQSVEKDYRDIIGTRIPFHRLKYNSVEHFLKSIPDVCEVRGTGSFAEVLPVITEKNAHINQMVTQQKHTKKGRKNVAPRRPRGGGNMAAYQKGFRRSSQPLQQPHSFNNAFSPNSSTLINISINQSASAPTTSSTSYNNYVNGASKTMNTNIVSSTKNVVKSKDTKTNLKENIFGKNSDSHEDLTTNRKKHLQHLIEMQTQLGNITKSNIFSSAREPSKHQINNLPDQTSNMKIPDYAPVIDEDDKFYANKNGKISATIQSSCTASVNYRLENLQFEDLKLQEEEDTSNVPSKVQTNLKTLIGQFDEGMWCSDLPRHYMRLFRKRLTFMEYGYSNLIDMCIALKHIFHYVRPDKDDFKLYDRNKPLPKNIETSYSIASYDLGNKIAVNALPNLDWKDVVKYLPDGIFNFGQEIPRAFIPKGTKADDVFDVVVVEVYDPSKFWFYLGKTGISTPLDDLMNELQSFYSSPENAKDYAVPPDIVKEGLYCVQVIYGEYHRARVMRVLPESDEVRVLYIDYGTITRAPIKGMCFLHSTFAQLPAQAIRGRLANLTPLEKGMPWPRPAIERFRDLVNRRDMKIKVSYVNWDEEYVSFFLADVTDVNNISYVNETLVKERHALWDGEVIDGIAYDVDRAKNILVKWKLAVLRRRPILKKKGQKIPFILSNFKCKVQNLHLFPTFLELEYGLAPNSTEMELFDNFFVPLHFCIPQYFGTNELVSSSYHDRDIEHMESCLIETVKINRKLSQREPKVDSKMFTESPAIDFDVFGELKNDIYEFCVEQNLIQNDDVIVGNEQAFCESDKEIWDNTINSGYEIAQLIEPNKGYQIQSEKVSPTPGDMINEMTAILELSEFRSGRSDPPSPEESFFGLLRARTAQDNEVDVFDKSDLEDENRIPEINMKGGVSPETFLKNLEMYCEREDCDGNFSDRDATGNLSTNLDGTENPFRLNAQKLIERFDDINSGTIKKNACRIKSTLDISESSDLQASISSLSLNNPFRPYLKDKLDNDNISTISSIESDTSSNSIFAARYKPLPPSDNSNSSDACSPIASLIDLESSDEKSHIESSESKKFVSPNTTPCAESKSFVPENTSPNRDDFLPTQNPFRPVTNTIPMAKVGSMVFAPSADTVPMGPPPYPQWSNWGNYATPIYPQWSNNGHYPRHYVPQQIRPPPGFTHLPQYSQRPNFNQASGGQQRGLPPQIQFSNEISFYNWFNERAFQYK